jgi:hypothetical protein
MPHILHELADAAADFLRANSDNHRFRLSILRFLRLLLIRDGLSFPLAASSGHCGGAMVELLIGVDA